MYAMLSTVNTFYEPSMQYHSMNHDIVTIYALLPYLLCYHIGYQIGLLMTQHAIKKQIFC